MRKKVDTRENLQTDSKRIAYWFKEEGNHLHTQAENEDFSLTDLADARAAITLYNETAAMLRNCANAPDGMVLLNMISYTQTHLAEASRGLIDPLRYHEMRARFFMAGEIINLLRNHATVFYPFEATDGNA